MADLPTGTVTFVFTDIEGSTRLLQRLGDGYAAVLAEHRRIVREAIAAGDGQELGTEGDSFFAVFRSAPHAVDASVRAQRALAGHPWAEGSEIRVRMGLHTGEGTLSDGSYVGLDVHRAARLAAAGSGGQILLSSATCSVVEQALPDGVRIHDLGLHRLKDLAQPEHLFQLDIDGLPTYHPALRTLGARRDNLPEQLTSFIGRGADIAAVEELLGRARLVTLTGPGGTGKTRLALRVAADLLDRSPDGTFFIDLAPISDPAVVPSAMATAMGVRASPDQPLTDALREHARERRLLLVLDNFEQVTQAAPLVSDLLSVSPALRVLVTSRVALHLQGEHEYPVPSLEVPDAAAAPGALLRSDGVALFVERARAVSPGFAATDDVLRDVATIVARLDGLPLAVELAAARTRLFTPAALLPRLEHALSLLTTGAADLPTRQRTLRDAIAWSYGLLEPADRIAFGRLSVFAGGAMLRATEAVVTDSADATPIDVLASLGSLVDNNLLRVRPDADDEPRFDFLETIREFAAERLSVEQAALVRDRHADFFIAFVESAEEHGRGPEKADWLRRLVEERENFRSALAWTLGHGDGLRALRLAASLDRSFWFAVGGVAEGIRALEAALALAQDAPPAVRAKALQRAGWMAADTGDYGRGRAFFEESLSEAVEAGDDAGIAEASMGQAYGALQTGDGESSEARFRRALVHAERSGQAPLISEVLVGLGHAALSRAEDAIAEEHFDRAVVIARDAHDSWGTAWALLSLAQLAIAHGDTRRTEIIIPDALDLARLAGDAALVDYGLLLLATMLIESGDLEAARPAIDEAGRSALELATTPDLIWTLELGARWLLEAGAATDALDAWAGAQAFRSRRQGRDDPISKRMHERIASRFRDAFAHDRIETAIRLAGDGALDAVLLRAIEAIRMTPPIATDQP